MIAKAPPSLRDGGATRSTAPAPLRKPKALWMWWHGREEPDLDSLWRSYRRRFSVEYGIRFLKHALGWTARATPRAGGQMDMAGLGRPRPTLPRRGRGRGPQAPMGTISTIPELDPNTGLEEFRDAPSSSQHVGERAKPRGHSPGRPKGSRSGRAAIAALLRHGASRTLVRPGSQIGELRESRRRRRRWVGVVVYSAFIIVCLGNKPGT